MTLKPRYRVGPGKQFCQSPVLSGVEEVGLLVSTSLGYSFTPNKLGDRLGLKSASGITKHEVFQKAQGVT